MKNQSADTAFISIITVVRNGERFIESTIKSVISQTFQNLQFVIIDGASTDGTLKIIDKYSEAVSYFRSEPDKGIYDAMNKGLKVATAPWIIFMNAGDTFYDQTVLADFSSFVSNKSNIDLVYGDVLMVYSEGEEEKKILKDSAGFLIRNMICHQCIFYAKKLFQCIGDFNTKYSVTADFEHLVRTKWGNFKIDKMDIIIARYQMDGVSSKDMNIAQIWKERIQIFQKLTTLPFYIRWPYLLYAKAAYEFRKRL